MLPECLVLLGTEKCIVLVKSVIPGGSVNKIPRDLLCVSLYAVKGFETFTLKKIRVYRQDFAGNRICIFLNKKNKEYP